MYHLDLIILVTIIILMTFFIGFNPISTGGVPPRVLLLPLTFLFLSQFPPNLVTFPKI